MDNKVNNRKPDYLKIATIAIACSVLSELAKSMIEGNKILASALGILVGGVISYFIPPKMTIPFQIWFLICAAIAVLRYVVGFLF